MRTCVRMAGRTPPPRGPRVAPLQLELGAADRLAALIEESGEPLAPERAAGALLALPRVPGELARRVLEEVVQDDARLVRHDDGRVGLVGLAPPPSTPLASAAWTVVDLETTGVGASARIVEIGAVRLEGGEQVGTLSRLVDPGIPMPPRITQITGIRDRDLRGRGPAAAGARRVPRARARQRPRRAQRVLRRRHARPRADAPRRHAHRHARARHRRARAPPAGRAAGALRPRQRLGALRRDRPALPPRAARRARHGRGAARADRARPGARRGERRGRDGARAGRAAARAPAALPRGRPARRARACT